LIAAIDQPSIISEAKVHVPMFDNWQAFAVASILV
jgi:hypothetical protein